MNQITKCPWCNAIHEGKCPLVKAIEYHLDGTIKRVEFYSAADHYLPITYPSPVMPQPSSPTPWPTPLAPTVTW